MPVHALDLVDGGPFSLRIRVVRVEDLVVELVERRLDRSGPQQLARERCDISCTRVKSVLCQCSRRGPLEGAW